MEGYVTTTYRLQELHICAQVWYVTTTYHLYTNDEKECSICIWSFQSWVLSLLTTGLVCPPAQGVTVHKPRRYATTHACEQSFHEVKVEQSLIGFIGDRENFEQKSISLL